MGRISKIIEQLNDSEDRARETISELVNAGMPALPSILNAIRNGPTQGHILLRQVILQIDDQGIYEEMQALIDDENPYIRSIAYRVLGRSNDQSLIDKLEEYFENDNLNESDRASAAKALADGMHFDSLPILIKQLKVLGEDNVIQYYPDLTLAISYSMAKLGDSSALPYVLELSKSEDITIRLTALKLLRFFVGPGVFEQLKSTLFESVVEIRKDALDALSLLGTKNATCQIWKLCWDDNIIIAQHARKRLTQIMYF